MTRKLAGDEKALWARVIATVTPLQGKPAGFEPEEVPHAEPQPGKATPKRRSQPIVTAARHPPHRGTTLDGSWDRRLGRGLVQPDLVVDLHGRNLASAYEFLDRKLEEAVNSGSRILLLITGKAPQVDRWPVARGAIRAAVGDWLNASRHSRYIAAVRPAHPRHGGAGALYIVLRRPVIVNRQNS